MAIPVIRTDRLILRGWSEADRSSFAAINADPTVTEFLGGGARGRAASDSLVDRIQDHWRAHRFGLWAVERRDTGAFIGFTGLSVPLFDAPFMPAVEVGWRLARTAWGHGFATEGAGAALQFGFERLGLDEIVSFTVPANARSRRVMERIGMTRDPADDFDHPGLPVGHPLRPHVLYRITRRSWAAAR